MVLLLTVFCFIVFLYFHDKVRYAIWGIIFLILGFLNLITKEQINYSVIYNDLYAENERYYVENDSQYVLNLKIDCEQEKYFIDKSSCEIINSNDNVFIKNEFSYHFEILGNIICDSSDVKLWYKIKTILK